MAVWHLEHMDGTPWTREEIMELKTPDGNWADSVTLDPDGTPLITNQFGRWYFLDEVTHDAYLVWDLKWHLEHLDGDEFTQDDLDDMARKLFKKVHGFNGNDVVCSNLSLGMNGKLVLTDNYGDMFLFNVPEKKMRFVWDG